MEKQKPENVTGAKREEKAEVGPSFPPLKEHSYPSHLFIYLPLGFPGASLSRTFGQCLTLWCDRLQIEQSGACPRTLSCVLWQDTSLIQASWLIFSLKRSPVTS